MGKSLIVYEPRIEKLMGEKGDLSLLYDILSYRRRADSKGERAIIWKHIKKTGAKADSFGNYILKIGDKPNVLWSSHTDTVHIEKDDDINMKQQLFINKDGILSTTHSSCLGGDNGVGVFLMLKMIENNKEGLYIFHRKEETGRQGSEWIVKHTPEILEGIDYAIAFDRRNTCSVITHQISRTCSDTFASELCSKLNIVLDDVQDRNYLLKPDNTGSYTDTKSYSKIVPECTNISAGFSNEHSYNENVDTLYVSNLLKAVLTLDTKELSVARDPEKDNESAYSHYYYTHGNNVGYHPHRTTGNVTYYRNGNTLYDDYDTYYNSFYEDNEQTEDNDENNNTLLELIYLHPRAVHDLLEEWGLGASFVEEIESRVKSH